MKDMAFQLHRCQSLLSLLTFIEQAIQPSFRAKSPINGPDNKAVYNVIAQKDSALNLRVAQASQRDSAAMKAIAEDSKMVALATSKDSAAMRTIAAVTILFLPAIFTAISLTFLVTHERCRIIVAPVTQRLLRWALYDSDSIRLFFPALDAVLTPNLKTLFSTSFFDFQAGRDPQVVSWWIWLYWLVTIILTVVIHITWYFTFKRKENQISTAFGKRDEEIEAFGKRNEEMWSALVRGPAQDAAITAKGPDEKAPNARGRSLLEAKLQTPSQGEDAQTPQESLVWHQRRPIR
ncbi:hypothetical protein H2201_007114 [Coniosporium apollinis]|uniref:DUF3533 domain-containing protein n=1 Tax=Coniosporium apollinis TaxID=61459 RepID=A0ABQ9NRQ3_9PEZI|nr:hypothetical protein H2201_007114 [Coniosporium apollinis]